jgi:GNAT superfamily N-acetyltransferase
MAIRLATPRVDELAEVLDVLRAWQRDDGPPQLHPGDVGWFWRFGAETTAAAVRTWERDGDVLGVGLLDGPTLLRLALAPTAVDDEELAVQLLADLTQPGREVLPAGPAYVEAPPPALVHGLLAEAGWPTGEAWTPLRRDLSEPVPTSDVRIEVVGPEQVEARSAVQRAAFDGSTFSVERWHAMVSGPAYADARCLLAYDGNGDAVAAVTVWSAGPGRPGLLEPMGVHREHRGHGHGSAVCLAAAAQLRELGASSATVCTPSANVAAVVTYTAAGFQPRGETRDRCRVG